MRYKMGAFLCGLADDFFFCQTQGPRWLWGCAQGRTWKVQWGVWRCELCQQWALHYQDSKACEEEEGALPCCFLPISISCAGWLSWAIQENSCCLLCEFLLCMCTPRDMVCLWLSSFISQCQRIDFLVYINNVASHCLQAKVDASILLSLLEYAVFEAGTSSAIPTEVELTILFL